MSDARDSLRRIRSAGDMPAPSIRSPEPALFFLPSRHSESHVHPPDPIPGAPPSLDTENLPPAMSRSPQSAGLIIEGMRPPAPPPILEQQPAPIAQPVAPLNTSMYSRTMRFFGHGRTPAARARKLLVSLWYNLAWGFVQVRHNTRLGAQASCQRQCQGCNDNFSPLGRNSHREQDKCALPVL